MARCGSPRAGRMGLRDPDLVNDINVQRAARLRLYSPGQCHGVSVSCRHARARFNQMSLSQLPPAALTCY